MQTTVKQQLEALIKAANFFDRTTGSDVVVMTQDEVQALRDVIDNMLAMKLINWEEILSCVRLAGPDVLSENEVQEQLRSIESLNLLIDTFKG